ncbi:MAG: LytTR family DNA-binding domain-containing protein [Pseudomonadota bacterium]
MSRAAALKVLRLDGASPEYARLCRLLDGGARTGTVAGLAELLALAMPGDLLLLQPCQRQARRLCVRVPDGLRQLPVAEVRYFQAEDKYVWARTAQNRLLIRAALDSLAREYAGHFVRIHRNALVARQYLTGLVAAGRGPYRASLAGIGETLPVSRRRLAAVRRLVRAGQGACDLR